MRRATLALALAACGVRAPPPIDVVALVVARGPDEARRALQIRILEAPKDVAARLGLAALDEHARPSEAIDQLEVVETLGGPAGVRWHADDRARFARLLAARGRARLARGAASALADLERAVHLGAAIAPDELDRARVARAVAELRRVPEHDRADGRAVLARATGPGADPSWRGARAGASPAERGAFGAWLWARGARREAYEQLAAWHDATPAPRDPALAEAYLRAVAWWSPSWLGEVPPPPAEDLVGAERCRFADARCDPRAVAGDPEAAHALIAAPLGPRTAEPGAATAYAVLALRAALAGDGGWGELLAARVDLAALDARGAELSPAMRAIVARLGGRAAGAPSGTPATAADRLLAAAARALASAPADVVRAALGPDADTPDGRALLAVVAPAPPPALPDPRAAAAVRYALARTAGAGADAPALLAVARAFRRDPDVAERLGRELVAAAPDAALAEARLGALFEALGDLSRARTAWQVAADASAEPAFLLGLADTEARAGDPDAATVNATSAAGAWGDPAIVWTDLARALVYAGAPVPALVADRDALDLAGPDVLPDALDAGIAASRALGRTAQADALTASRARLSPPSGSGEPADPTDAAAALIALRAYPGVTSIARAWVASRWNSRAVELRAVLLAILDRDDPRRATLVAELVALAGDRDPIRAIRACDALAN